MPETAPKPQFIQNLQDMYARRSMPEWTGTNYWGTASTPGGERAFGLASGLENKMMIKDGQVSWRGFSGILQFIHKFPFGYLGGPDSKWGLIINQIFWNIVIFVLLFGSIYGLMIKTGHFKVPENAIKAQNTGGGGIEADATTTNENYMQQGLYFAVVTTTTLGFGDIVPKTVGAQVMVMFHMLLFFIFNFIWYLDYAAIEL